MQNNNVAFYSSNIKMRTFFGGWIVGLAILEMTAGESWADLLAQKAKAAQQAVASAAPKVYMTRPMQCGESADTPHKCSGKLHLGPDACGSQCEFELELSVLAVIGGDEIASLHLVFSVDSKTLLDKTVTLLATSEAVTGRAKVRGEYAALESHRTCIPVLFPVAGTIGVCSSFAKILNEPQGISNDYTLSFLYVNPQITMAQTL